MPNRIFKILLLDDNEDDHVLLRCRLKPFLKGDTPRYELVGLAEYGKLMDELTRVQPDVLILDYRLGLEDGKDVLTSLRERGIQLPVIAWSGAGDEYVAADMVEAGAVGYLNKAHLDGSRIEELLDKALKQGEQLSRAVADRDEFEARLATLSDREAELLPFIIAGWSNPQIAAHFYRSSETIKSHRAHLLKKLDLNSTAVLIQCCLRAGVKPADVPEGE